MKIHNRLPTRNLDKVLIKHSQSFDEQNFDKLIVVFHMRNNRKLVGKILTNHLSDSSEFVTVKNLAIATVDTITHANVFCNY